MIYNNYIKSCW